jgi:hypothetical protein
MLALACSVELQKINDTLPADCQSSLQGYARTIFNTGNDSIVTNPVLTEFAKLEVFERIAQAAQIVERSYTLTHKCCCAPRNLFIQLR